MVPLTCSFVAHDLFRNVTGEEEAHPISFGPPGRALSRSSAGALMFPRSSFLSLLGVAKALAIYWRELGSDIKFLLAVNDSKRDKFISNFGPLFLQSGFSDAVFRYMRGFCRDFVVNFTVDFCVDFLSSA